MFTSVPFLLPAVLLFINLGACTVHRLTKRWNAGAKHRHGPDILHLGLLVLMVGGVVTFMGRTEEMVYLREGESAEMPGSYVVTLEEFRFERYEDGTAKDWISVVSVTQNGSTVKSGAEIEVNSSLRVGRLKLYQSGFGLDEGIVLDDQDGNRYWLTYGDAVPLEDGDLLVLREIGPGPLGSDNLALFEIRDDRGVVGQRTEAPGSAIGEWVMTEVVFARYTGLQMVHDPGYTTVLIALILVVIGLFLTYYQKIGDNEV
jgi:cytochrome c biogenesis protein ResB